MEDAKVSIKDKSDRKLQPGGKGPIKKPNINMKDAAELRRTKRNNKWLRFCKSAQNK